MSRHNIFKSGQQQSNNNSRFSFIDEDLKMDQKLKLNGPRETNNLFTQRPTNVITQSKPIEQTKTQNNLNSFPVLGLGKATSSDTKIKEPTPIINNSYSKAIKHENAVVVVEEDKDELIRKSVKPGWISIFKNKSGKTEMVYGPKTDEEKQKDFEKSSMKYQMYLAITRMEERWKREKQHYDDMNGPNAFNERYGYRPTYDSDDDNLDDSSDSEYETDYETE
uniref:Uncharacterized protein n=1 Tax=viral metagenome TaxID=1070528 RepID=A0A6C0IA30_9ZZZZ